MRRPGRHRVEPDPRSRAAPATARSGAEQRFATWLRSAAGQRLLAVERPLLRQAVRRCHGDALLWIGSTADLLDTTNRCMVRSRFFAAHGGCANRLGKTRRGMAAGSRRWRDVKLVAAKPAELPFASASVDGVVLHHALEAERDRHAVLREATRVLRPGGRLLVVGFNPLSLWLLAKPHPAFRHLTPVSVPRLHDWLALLGLRREEKTTYLNYRSVLPLALARRRWQQLSAWLNKLQLPLGGTYLIVATKVAHGFIAQPRRLGDEARAHAAPTALPNPATRQASE